MALAHSPKIVTNGLVLCLDAANIKSYPGSGTTWADLSGNNRNASLNNGPAFTNINGGAFSFDGVNDDAIVTCPLIKDFTLDFWMKSQGSSTGSGRSVLEYGGSTYGIIAVYTLSQNSCSFYFATVGGTISPNLTTRNLADNAWHNVAMTYDGINGKVYIDQTLLINVNVGLSGNLRNTSNTQFSVAKWRSAVAYQEVTIGSLKVYNRALFAEEIFQNFNALRGRFGI